jgi:hypothetical protein
MLDKNMGKLKYNYPYIYNMACTECGTIDRPIYAKNMCSRCYYRIRDAKRYKEDPRRREYLKKKGRESTIEFNKFIESHLGSTCVNCGTTEDLEKHEKNHKVHPYTQWYYRKNIHCFELLCRPCHFRKKLKSMG